MSKQKKVAALCLAFVLLLSACGQKAELSVDSPRETTAAATDKTIVNNVADPAVLFSERDYETAHSEDKAGKIQFNGTTITGSTDAAKISDSKVEITEEGTYILSGTLENGQVVVNVEKTDKIQLVLNGADITSEESAAIYVLQADKVFITTVKGTENVLKNGGTFEAIDDNNIDGAIFSKDDLTLNGEGKLYIESPAGHGIVCKDDLVVTCGEYVVSSASQALNGKQSVRIAGGIFNLTAGKDGIHAEDNDDVRLGYGYISGGVLAVTASGDGIDANGTLEITGGHTAVCGPTQGDTAALDYDKTAIISGGTFIGTGASGMAQTFSDLENQGVIALQVGSAAANTAIILKDAAGKEIVNYAPALGYNVVIISTPDMAKGETYTITVGSQSGEFTAS